MLDARCSDSVSSFHGSTKCPFWDCFGFSPISGNCFVCFNTTRLFFCPLTSILKVFFLKPWFPLLGNLLGAAWCSIALCAISVGHEVISAILWGFGGGCFVKMSSHSPPCLYIHKTCHLPSFLNLGLISICITRNNIWLNLTMWPTVALSTIFVRQSWLLANVWWSPLRCLNIPKSLLWKGFSWQPECHKVS